MEPLLKRPSDRDGFRIGIICALSLEAEMVEFLFDERHSKDSYYGKAPNDPNTYTTGVIGNHNAVLAYCPGMGNDSAARTASRMMLSFVGIKVIFVVGICGAVPAYSCQGVTENIYLGDCLISTAVIQLDLGREGPAGFKKKDGLDGLSRPTDQIRTLMAKLQTSTNRSELAEDLITQLDRLCLKQPDKIKYPGKDQDRLYKASYIHSHHTPLHICEDCDVELGVCAKDCENLGCKDQESELRRKDEDSTSPKIHFGHFGSSNRVLKSGCKRDKLAKLNNVIAFEMEGAGVWDICPTIVIKSACDYADSHKNKKWQTYSAATAAAGLKAFLRQFERSEDTIYPKATTALRITTSSVMPELIYEADRTIREYYKSSNRLCVERLTGEKLPLENCYINLGLTNRSNRKNEKEKDVFSVQARLKLDESTTEGTILLSNLFEPRNLSASTTANPRRIYIQGRAGVGKTTLCKKIVHEFLQGLWSGMFDRLLWLPLRSLKSRTSGYGWLDLLQDAYSPRVEDWNKLAGTMAKQLLNKEFLDRTLFLFDGLDELSHRWAREDKMFQFVESIICDMPNIIVTSRPQANSFDTGRFDLELETMGFTLDQIDTYLENCVKDKANIPRMKISIAKKPLIQGLLRIPIQLDAFCCTWSAEMSSTQSDEGMSTMTTLYQSITNELFRKDVERLDKAAQPRRLTEVKIGNHLQEELVLLEEYAFQGMTNSLATFVPRHRDMIDSFLLDRRGQISDLDSFILERLSFLRTSDIEEDPSKRNYHFLHLTFQEFFAAKHFVRCWRSDDDLVCLGLSFDNLGDETVISPVRFLQIEKYNPRYNLFWRFVTGLVQLQTERANNRREGGLSVKNEPILTLFEQLNGSPRDLLKSTHRRLLMYCLNEIVPNGRRHIQELHQKEGSELRKWAGDKLYFTKTLWIGSEVEFPEGILCDLFRSSTRITTTRFLTMMLNRPFVSMETLRFVFGSMYDQLHFDDYGKAIKLAFKNSRAESQEIVEQAVQLFSSFYKHQGDPGLLSLLVGLRGQSPLPHSIIAQITAALGDANVDTRSTAVDILGKQSYLPPESMAALLGATKDTSDPVRESALRALSKSSLPIEDITELLMEASKDKASNVRSTSIKLIGTHSPALNGCITTIIAALEDEAGVVRASSAKVLAEWPSLPTEGPIALLAALQDESTDVQIFAALALIKHSSFVSEGLSVFVAAIRNENSLIRADAVLALDGQALLPRECKILLKEALWDKHWLVSMYAMDQLCDQSPLSEKDINALLPALDEMRDYFAYKLLSVQDLFYPTIQHLSDQKLKSLWHHWTEAAESQDVCCYEFEGCLYLRIEGVLHQICSDPLRIEQLLRVVLPGRGQMIQSDTNLEVQPIAVAGDVPTHAERNQKSRWPTWLKSKKHG